MGGDVGRESSNGSDAVREVVVDRLVVRSCAWCGEPVRYSGRGRPPRYCRPSHRRRASELARAQARADVDTARGERTTEPVREVIERTMVRTVRPGRQCRGVTRVVKVAPSLPSEWRLLLGELVDAAAHGRIPPADRERLAVLADQAATLLRADVDGPRLPRAERRRREREARKRRR